MSVRIAVIFPVLCIALIGIIALANATSETSQIPNWIKNNARWWSDGTISDSDFVSGLQYLISQGVLKVSNVAPSKTYSLVYTGTEKLVTTIRTNSSYYTAFDSYGQVSCEDNETLTGGGYSSPFHQSLSVYQNQPSADGKKWMVAMQYNPPSSRGTAYIQPPPFNVYALCTKIGS